MGFLQYLSRYEDIFPIAEDPVSVSPPYWLWMGRGWRPVISPFLADEQRVLWCPSDTTAVEKYESTSYAYSMAFYHSPDQINAMSSPADTYATPVPSRMQRLARVRHPSRKVLAGEWLSNHDRTESDKGWWCWEGVRGYLFVDGHAAHMEAKRILPARDGFPDPNLTVDGIRGADAP